MLNSQKVIIPTSESQAFQLVKNQNGTFVLTVLPPVESKSAIKPDLEATAISIQAQESILNKYPKFETFDTSRNTVVPIDKLSPSSKILVNSQNKDFSSTGNQLGLKHVVVACAVVLQMSLVS